MAQLPPDSLAEYARAIVSERSPVEKVALARLASNRWRSRALSKVRQSGSHKMPKRPGRPEHPKLLAPREMPRRSTSGLKGRLAMVHALAHIELNAIDLSWDLVGRFITTPMPRSFFDDWVQVGHEEAGHFELLSKRLHDLGANYGDLPAHDGLWQAAQDTEHDLKARIAVVPLVLEARGLDVTPSMIDKLTAAGDTETAAVLQVVYEDEKRHVAYGAKWFRYMCERDGSRPEAAFQALVRTHFRGALKPPFNDKARSEAGLTPGFYKPLVGVGRFD
jgi:uncharacterized ferritin-like protein (DUF455 family)